MILREKGNSGEGKKKYEKTIHTEFNPASVNLFPLCLLMFL